MHRFPRLSLDGLARTALGLLLAAGCGLALAADPEPPMTLQQVGPHSYYVQGESALGSGATWNITRWPISASSPSTNIRSGSPMPSRRAAARAHRRQALAGLAHR